MTLAQPYFLVLLLLLPATFLLRRRRSDGAAAVFSTHELLKDYRPTWRIRSRWMPSALRAIALTLMIVALSRPQAIRADTSEGTGIDIVLSLDLSSSMDTRFGDGTRLDAAKNVLTKFIEGRTSDRIGLVVFKNESLALSPLTTDYASLTDMLAHVDQLKLPDGTAIGDGTAEALNLLRDSRARSRTVVLLTDGENNAGRVEPLAAARIAESLGIRLYTVGVVEQRNKTGVDVQALRKMADLTGGSFALADNPDVLQSIYARIGELEKSRIDSKVVTVTRELAPRIIVVAVILLAFEVACSSTIWRRAA